MDGNKSCRHQQHSMDTTTDSLIIPAGKVGLIITVKIGVSKSGQNAGQKWPKVCQFFRGNWMELCWRWGEQNNGSRLIHKIQHPSLVDEWTNTWHFSTTPNHRFSPLFSSVFHRNCYRNNMSNYCPTNQPTIQLNEYYFSNQN